MVALVWILSLFFLMGHCRALSRTAVPTGSSHISATPANDACPHYKWLIVGGGIHGVGIAARLVGEGKIDIGTNNHSNGGGRLLVVDEHPTLLHSWKERTRSVGMVFLRSSAGFHLDVPAEGLREFAGDYRTTATANPSTRKKKPSKKELRKAKNNRNKVGNPNGSFVGSDYQRPALELFNNHCDLVVEKYGLNDYFFRGRVESIFRSSNNNNGTYRKAEPARLTIRTGPDALTTTTVSADNIVLAVGNDDPLFPEWAADLASKNANSKISHLLQISNSSDFHRSKADSDSKSKVVVIIGGGISAVHKALQLTSVDNINDQKQKESNTRNGVVHIISRHPVREQQFDTHQDWMMTKELAERSIEKGGKGLTERLREFQTIKAPTDRREVIKRERVPGTIPTYMTRARGGLEEAISYGKVHWHVAGVTNATENGSTNNETDGRYQLQLSNGKGIAADEIILATGLGKRPPGHRIIHPLAKETGLPLSPCGYPLVDPSLQWKPQCEGPSDGDIPYTSSKIFVAGGLAELELGPSARNIAGARMAAERISAVADD